MLRNLTNDNCFEVVDKKYQINKLFDLPETALI